MSEIQSVVFFPPRWNAKKAEQWLKSKDLSLVKGKSVDKVKKNGRITEYRYRIEEPHKFKRFVTKKTKTDLNLIIGFT